MPSGHYDGGAFRRQRARNAVRKATPRTATEAVPPSEALTEWIQREDIRHCSEADLIVALITRFRWRWEGKDKLGRHNPFNINVRALVEEGDHEAA